MKFMLDIQKNSTMFSLPCLPHFLFEVPAASMVACTRFQNRAQALTTMSLGMAANTAFILAFISIRQLNPEKGQVSNLARTPSGSVDKKRDVKVETAKFTSLQE